LEFSLSTGYKLDFIQVESTRQMSVFVAQEAHTSLKSHHELSIFSKDFTSQSEVAQIKTYPISHKASLKRDKSTDTSGEHEQLIELLNFNMCSTL
jgi:hypothetical protein